MEESNTVDARLPWASLCNVNELAFRTACNAAVAASSRPIKRRVIHRLAQSAEAQRVFSFVWMSAEKKGNRVWKSIRHGHAQPDSETRIGRYGGAAGFWKLGMCYTTKGANTWPLHQLTFRVKTGAAM
jgi:hypothetical protein